MKKIHLIFILSLFGFISCESTLGELWEKNQVKSDKLKNQLLTLCKTNVSDSINNTKQNVDLCFYDEFKTENEFNSSDVMLEGLENCDFFTSDQEGDDSSYVPRLFNGVMMDYFAYTAKNSELKGRKQKSGKAYDRVFEAVDQVRYIHAVRVVSHNRNAGICVTDNYLCDLDGNKTLLAFRLITMVNPCQNDVVLPVNAKIKVKGHRSVGGHSTTIEEKDLHVSRNEIIGSYEQSLTKAFLEQRNAYLGRYVRIK